MRHTTLALLLAMPLAAADGFVLIQGGSFRGIRVDSFEILDHPVTNLEYAEFVKAAGHAAPLHWEKGAIPAGMEQWPVTFVNRYDAVAYCEWRSKKEGRLYRLPMAAEFEYAARGGLEGKRYPWGDEDPAGRANFDPGDGRTFAGWRKLIKPVKSFKPNGYGLFDMAGNVWQMVTANTDPETRRYVYRITNPVEKEGSVMGGSWARLAMWLRCGASSGVSTGIRHPDVGFRPVRAPAGATHFTTKARGVLAAPAGKGSIYIGWRWLESDKAGAGFHVYRSLRRDAAGERLTSSPIGGSTNFVDHAPPRAERVYYRVRPVDAAGKEGAPSEWAGASPAEERTGIAMTFQPAVKTGPYVIVFGDLDGDGRLDAVVRAANGITEMSRDPGVPVEFEAFTSFGRQLWRRPVAQHDKCFGSANNLPFNVYDLDGDGKAEVIGRVQDGDQLYLAVLEGTTGRILRKTPWRKMATDHSGTSTRVHMAIAYLDGKTPAIITQTGLYENEIFDAYDAKLNNLWTFRSFGETNGSGSHHIDVADVDGDGRDEVFDGTTVINPDGRMRWSIYRQHPDIVAIKHILPGSKDRQVYYAVETGMHAGAFLVDAKSGKIIWKLNREDDPRWTHAHVGWAADIYEGSPGMEMLTNRDGHDAKQKVLFSAEGKILADPFLGDWRPVNWSGGAVRDLMSANAKRFGKFTGAAVIELPGDGPNTMARASCPMVGDLAGDYRDEIVCSGALADGTPVIHVYTNLEEARRREPARMEDREYRIWVGRNMGGGYPNYFEWQGK